VRREPPEYVEPQLNLVGDWEEPRRVYASILAGGTGADRQRADFEARHSLFDVVDGLIARTDCGIGAYAA
jgi:hypothetical protein